MKSILGPEYKGRKATGYDVKRMTQNKWLRENQIVAEYLDGVTGTLMDVPFGTGRFLPLYRRLGVGVTGIDSSEDMLAEARKKLTKKDHMLTLLVGDVTDLKYGDQSFNTVVCVRMLHLMPRPLVWDALHQILRVAKDRVIITAQLGETYNEGHEVATHNEKGFRQRITKAGFCIAAEEKLTTAGWYIMKLERI